MVRAICLLLTLATGCALGTRHHAVEPEARTPGRRRRRRLPTPRLGRVNHGMQSAEPTIAPLVADDRHDQEVARARGRHVEDARRFLVLTLTLVLAVSEQLGR